MKTATKSRTVYGIAGDGKLAKHLLRYLAALQLPCRQWSRKKSKLPPQTALACCTHIIIAISDDAIEPFIRANFAASKAVLIHCSGSLCTELAYGAHPLYVFGTKLLTLAEYKKIPFVTEKSGPAFAKLLPGLPNAHFEIPVEQKPLYHALCVLSSNFSTLLWDKFFDGAKQLGIPHDAAHAYFASSARNICGERAFTGPLARGDKKTMHANITALRGDKFAHVYKTFAKHCAGRGK
jgi:predicted short-subunit dehydrogenase-like oxidoreductase (DUF2520 family)